MPSPRHHEPGGAGLPDPPEPVDVRLFRTEDLLVAQLRAPGCHVEPGPAGPDLVADTDPASLVLELPPQHLGEHAWLEGQKAEGLAPHRAAAPSRVVFALTVGARVPFTLEGILALLPTLPLRVAGHATPAEPSRRLDVGWTDAILVRGWERLLDRADAAGQAADLGDLVFGVDRPTVLRGSALSDSAARVLQRAQAGRLVGALNRPVSVVSVLARDEAGQGRGRAGGHTGIVLRPGRLGPVIRWRRGPRPPTDTETSIEAPVPPPGLAQPVRRVHPRPRADPVPGRPGTDGALADPPHRSGPRTATAPSPGWTTPTRPSASSGPSGRATSTPPTPRPSTTRPR